MKKTPDLVNADSTDEVLTLSKNLVMRKMVDPVRNALDMFEKNISRLIFLPDIPHVEFRVETMEILFDYINHELKGGHYRKFMKVIGKSVGKSLGRNMMEFLMKNNKLPRTDDVITKLWNEWDMIAGWGKIKTFHENSQIRMTIEDSFLTRGIENDKHKHCPFIEGYVQGFLWVALKERYRWFKRTITQPSDRPREPLEVNESPLGDKCQFVVKLGEEELEDAFDSLSDAFESLRLGNPDQAANNTRISLELAFKDKVGIEKDSKTSVLKIIKAFKKRDVKLRYKAIDEIYNLTCRTVHGSKTMNENICKDLIGKWDEILEELELLKLTESETESIRKEASSR
jgi:predicted hydrocarbon binding protein